MNQSEILEKYLNKKDKVFLENILSRKEYEDYFFSKNDELKWFKPLLEIGYFSATRHPKPIEIKKGSFEFPVWNVLLYIENITKNPSFVDDFEIQNEIIKIIESVTDYSKNEPGELQNFRTWWFFIKILINLPNEQIDTNLINNIDTWLDTKFDTLLITSEITQKLITKFVNENSTKDDINKAETIFNILFKITRYENPKEYSKFFGKVNYRLKADYFWVNELFSEGNFIKIFAEKNTQKFFEELEAKILVILKVEEDILKLKMNNDTISIGVKADKINYAYNFKVYLLSNISPLETRYDSITDTERDYKLLKEFAVNVKNFNEFSNSLKKEFRSIKEIRYNQKELDGVARDVFLSFYSSQTLESLYDDSRKPYSEPIELLCEVLKSTLLAKSSSKSLVNINLTKSILEKYLCHQFLFFKKVALYVMAESENDYISVFFKNLKKPEVNQVIFEPHYYGDELNHFLSRLVNLKQIEIDELKKYIERGSLLFDLEEVIPGYKILWKQKLYKALTHIEVFNKKYKELKSITSKDPELGPAIGMGDSGYVFEVSGKSPLSIEELLKKTNQEIVELITTLNSNRDNDPENKLGGLYNQLKEVIKIRPQKFVENLDPFLSTPINFINIIFESLREAIKDKKIIDWSKLFTFFSEYLNSVNWHSELKKEYSPFQITHKWNLNYIASLICEGARDEVECKIEDHNLQIATGILSKALDYFSLLKNDYQKFENEDYLTISINTTIGKLVEAFIYVSRRISLTDTMRNARVKLPVNVLKIYESLLKERIMEIHSLIGCYISIFVYINKNWLMRILGKIEKLYKDETILWNAFMDGYFWSGKVYIDIYKLQRKNYELALNFKFKNEHSQDKLIEHLTIGYLAGVDNLDKESLFGKMLNKNDSEVFSKIINTFWGFRHTIVFESYDENEKILTQALEQRKRIIEFWKWIYNYFEKKSTIDEIDRKAIASLGKLVVFLFEINSENKKWLMQVATYVGEYFNSTFFIEYLDKLKDKGKKKFSAKSVGEIYLEMMNNYLPDYKKENIKSIVTYLKSYPEDEIKILGQRIYDKYLRNNYYFLREN
ncbi:MAG: hypothetical protein L0Y79_00530 [Chlorobi bacterium]|nr:hypothetical protein [Chlorobiota bacterium]MCI0715734.1 hypothetical protein [Chlorobiota bacterium]